MKASQQKFRKFVLQGEADGLTLAGALDRFIVAMNGVKSPKTITWYRSLLQSLVDYLGAEARIGEIEIDDLRLWRATLVGKESRYVGHPKMKPKKGGISPVTLHAHVRACRHFFRWLAAEGKLEGDPAARLELPPKPKAVRKGIGDEERGKIVAALACPACRNQERDVAMIAFLDDTTCRAAGVVGLTLENLNLKGRAAIVLEKGLGGNRKSRFVFFSPLTEQLLEDWLSIRPEHDSERVFVQATGEPLSEKGLYEVLRRAARRAGVKRGWNPHNWRHGTIRRMLKKGINLGIVSQLAGHASSAITSDIYGTLDDRELREAVEGVMWPIIQRDGDTAETNKP